MIEQLTIGTKNLTEGQLPTVVLSQLSRLDGAIEKEFTLVSDRMTWMMISESFIFGAFTAAVVHYDSTKTLFYAMLALLALLPALGIAIAVLAFRAIGAAHIAADRLKNKRELLEKIFAGQIQVELVSSKLETHAIGNLPPKYLPPMIIATWIVLLTVVGVELSLTKNTAAIAIALSILLTYAGALYILNRTYHAQIQTLESRIDKLESNAVPNNPMDQSGGSAAS